MSNFICGTVFLNCKSKENIFSIRECIVNSCNNRGIGVHFPKESLLENESSMIKFQLSDNFEILYCERFMEPITYTLCGKPKVDSLTKDLETMQFLMKEIFCSSSVHIVELTFSYIEVDNSEYKRYETNISDMKNIILSEYLKSVQVPVIKVIVYK